ncbi:sulfatase family protein [Sinomicrobium sp. M5D2P17]
MKINKFHFLVLFFLLGNIVNSTAQKPISPGKNPLNIILFIADDLAAEDIGPYGNKIVNTPNLDRLAGESLLFQNAFASSPTCGPSRSSMFTGLMPFRHGGHGNHSGVKEGTQSLPHYLRPLNYKVAIAGKYHVGPEENFPFERIMNTNVPEPGFENNPGLHYDLNMEPVDSWLSEQKEEGPFMLVIADHSPHVIWPENSEYDKDEVDIPKRHIDTRDTRISRTRYYQDITKMDKNVGKLLSSLEKNGLEENTIVIFVSDQGPQWAFGKWSLYDYGVQSPMLIRWPGKIKANTKTKAMVSLIDLLPTFVEIGGGKAPGQIDGKSFLPLLTGKKDTHRKVVFATHTGDGQMNRSPSRMVRTERYKYILNLAPEVLYTTHMDKAKDHDGGREYWDSWREKSFTDAHAKSVLWRYHHHPKEELYDIKNDPQELNNLANNSEYSEIKESLRKQVKIWRKEQGDSETGPEDLSKKKKRKKPVAPYVF